MAVCVNKFSTRFCKTMKYSNILHLAWASTTTLLLTFLTGCGTGLTNETKFTVRMLGSLSQPAGATGTASPVAGIFLFNQVSLQPAEGGDPVELYTEEPLDLRIINRPQEIWSTVDLTELVDIEFSSATVELDDTVIIVDQDENEHNINLDSGSLTIDELFTITDGKETTITIRAVWGKTITPAVDETDAVVSAPTFSVSLGDGE